MKKYVYAYDKQISISWIERVFEIEDSRGNIFQQGSPHVLEQYAIVGSPYGYDTEGEALRVGRAELAAYRRERRK